MNLLKARTGTIFAWPLSIARTKLGFHTMEHFSFSFSVSHLISPAARQYTEIVGKALFSNISALLYKLDRAQHSDLG